MKSFTIAYLLACTVVLILMNVYQDGLTANDKTHPWVCTLYDFQAKYTYAIKEKYEVWRLLTPIFLHSNAIHLFWNAFSIMMISFMIEIELKSRLHYIGLLIMSGIGGNLLSAVLRPYSIGLGASSAIFGLLGVLMVWIWLNYEKFGPNGQQFLIFFLVLMILSTMNVFLSNTIDPWSHLGGFCVGVPFGLLFLKAKNFQDFGRLDDHKTKA